MTMVKWVGSGDPELPSHFTIVIAKITGVEWQAVLDEHKFFYQDVVIPTGV